MLTRKRGRPQCIEPRFSLKMLESYFWPERWSLPAHERYRPLHLRTAPTPVFQVSMLPAALLLAYGHARETPALRALTIGRRDDLRATLAVLADEPVWGTVERWSLLYLLYDRCAIPDFPLPTLYSSRAAAYAARMEGPHP